MFGIIKKKKCLYVFYIYIFIYYIYLGFDSEVELGSTLVQLQAQKKRKRKLVKQNKLIMKPETELEIVQMHILKFLGQLDMTTCLRLLGNPNQIANYPINIINYKLSFIDCKINISFGEFKTYQYYTN